MSRMILPTEEAPSRRVEVLFPDSRLRRGQAAGWTFVPRHSAGRASDQLQVDTPINRSSGRRRRRHGAVPVHGTCSGGARGKLPCPIGHGVGNQPEGRGTLRSVKRQREKPGRTFSKA